MELEAERDPGKIHLKGQDCLQRELMGTGRLAASVDSPGPTGCSPEISQQVFVNSYRRQGRNVIIDAI